MINDNGPSTEVNILSQKARGDIGESLQTGIDDDPRECSQSV